MARIVRYRIKFPQRKLHYFLAIGRLCDVPLARLRSFVVSGRRHTLTLATGATLAVRATLSLAHRSALGAANFRDLRC